jgi:hypothetical protein
MSRYWEICRARWTDVSRANHCRVVNKNPSCRATLYRPAALQTALPGACAILDGVRPQQTTADRVAKPMPC